jgi:hypothetical protein
MNCATVVTKSDLSSRQNRRRKQGKKVHPSLSPFTLMGRRLPFFGSFGVCALHSSLVMSSMSERGRVREDVKKKILGMVRAAQSEGVVESDVWQALGQKYQCRIIAAALHDLVFSGRVVRVIFHVGDVAQPKKLFLRKFY